MSRSSLSLLAQHARSSRNVCSGVQHGDESLGGSHVRACSPAVAAPQESPPLRVMVRDGHVDPHNGRDHAVLDDCASLGLHSIVPGSAVCGEAIQFCHEVQLGQLGQADQGACLLGR